MKQMQSRVRVVALALAFLAAPFSTPADELCIQSFDNTGVLTFNRIPTGQAYRVESATSLTGEWTRLTNAVTVDGIPTTMDCIPGKGGIATGAVPVQASSMFFRAVAETNDMVLIPAGEFAMGACTNMGHESSAEEVPQHTVYVDAFSMSRYEVTMGEWENVLTWATNHGYVYQPDTGEYARGNGNTHPIFNMGWRSCIMWCNARSEMEGLQPCYTRDDGTVIRVNEVMLPVCDWSANGYRLPTEAEWEKAARGGIGGHRFPWSDTDTIQNLRANYIAHTNGSPVFDTSTSDVICSRGTNSTSPVGSFAPNGYGLYDMTGNVAEWCWDLWSNTYYASSPTTNPRGPAPGGPSVYGYVIRGGAYQQTAYHVRICRRLCDQQAKPNLWGGFRTARSVVP